MNQDAYSRRNLAHNPEVAGSNPAPATQALSRVSRRPDQLIHRRVPGVSHVRVVRRRRRWMPARYRAFRGPLSGPYRRHIENRIRADNTAAALTGGMTLSEPARPAAGRTRSPASSSPRIVPPTGITIYGCGRDEAVLFREVAPRFGVVPTITEAAVSEANIELARGNRCISVGHKTSVTDSTLLALSRAGVSVRLHAKHRIQPHRRGLRGERRHLPWGTSPTHPTAWPTTR